MFDKTEMRKRFILVCSPPRSVRKFYNDYHSMLVSPAKIFKSFSSDIEIPSNEGCKRVYQLKSDVPNAWSGLLEAWLALTRVKYHGNK